MFEYQATVVPPLDVVEVLALLSSPAFKRGIYHAASGWILTDLWRARNWPGELIQYIIKGSCSEKVTARF
jgi:hypothetical protein